MTPSKTPRCSKERTKMNALTLVFVALCVFALAYRYYGLFIANKVLGLNPPIYGFVASALPVWLLLCPRDYLSTELTLKILERLSPFVRCHKQFLVNIEQVDEILLAENLLAQITTKAGRSVPVSRYYLKKLKERLGI
jgi:hypothetical protein